MQNSTIRQVVRTSIAGTSLRLRLTNEFGSQPLHLGEVHVARRAGESGTDIRPDTDQRVTFSGRTSVDVPAGAPMVSDPVQLPLPARADLIVSIFLPRPTPVTTLHGFPFTTNVLAAGNVTAARRVTATETVGQWWFLSGVSVTPRRGEEASSVVALGDSITNGANTTVDANRRWPDRLSERLQATERENIGVLNLGVAGNRLLHDPNPPAGSAAEGFAALFGQSALRRFDRDVVAQPGARHVILLLGVNDLGHPGTVAPLSEAVTTDQLITGYRQLIARAHERGLRIYGGTITPFKGDTLGFYSPEKEATRQAVNLWIRTSGEFDAAIDFDAALRDPADPERMLARYDSGDHLHPNDAGMQALADAVPLRLFDCH